MKKLLILTAVFLAFASCHTEEGGVANKVLSDWGLKAKPEGYVSGEDRVFEKLAGIGAAEMKRMNAELQHGEVKFQSEGEIKGKYYKEVKVFESFYPTEAKGVGRTSATEGGYQGYIEYAYRMYQSPRKGSRTEAEAETASIPTDTVGRDQYRYSFDATGDWNGAKGDHARTK